MPAREGERSGAGHCRAGCWDGPAPSRGREWSLMDGFRGPLLKSTQHARGLCAALVRGRGGSGYQPVHGALRGADLCPKEQAKAGAKFSASPPPLLGILQVSQKLTRVTYPRDDPSHPTVAVFVGWWDLLRNAISQPSLNVPSFPSPSACASSSSWRPWPRPRPSPSPRYPPSLAYSCPREQSPLLAGAERPGRRWRPGIPSGGHNRSVPREEWRDGEAPLGAARCFGIGSNAVHQFDRRFMQAVSALCSGSPTLCPPWVL